ncbi:MAG: antitoxin [Acidobacteriota bacterium]|nr:antitoxin [Acidobacteriota bacterium]
MKRLQVLMSDEELDGYHQIARAEGVRLSEWVRRTLRTAGRAASADRIERKLQAMEAAASWKAPAGDPEEMLAEIEAGRFAD